MKPCLLFLVALFFLAACSDTTKETVQQLSGDVLALHDSVMMKSGDLINLKTQIQTRIGQDSTARPMGDSLIAAITRADNAMSDWMSGYADAKKDMKDDDALKFYQLEKIKIMAVQAQTDESITRAKEFLKTSPQK